MQSAQHLFYTLPVTHTGLLYRLRISLLQEIYPNIRTVTLSQRPVCSAKEKSALSSSAHEISPSEARVETRPLIEASTRDPGVSKVKQTLVTCSMEQRPS
jgi:hypothetical protein